MTTGLLGDTSFLDTLQEASQVLNDRVSSSPFGNYTPSQASDYVVGPLGGIAQNKFMGDQFQMPNLLNAPYIPEAFNAASVLNAASTSPFNYNFGSYTPGAFNQFYGSPMTSPAMATTTTRASGGDGRERLEGFLSRNNLRSDLLNNRFIDIPEQYETTVPGLLGILDSIIGNVPREVAVDRIIRDIDASKDFGVNKFGLGTSYKGSR